MYTPKIPVSSKHAGRPQRRDRGKGAPPGNRTMNIFGPENAGHRPPVTVSMLWRKIYMDFFQLCRND
jgi:hypothetical protein